MENIKIIIRNFKEIMCCLNKNESNELERHSNYDYYNLSTYNPYFNSQFKSVDPNLTKNSFFTSESNEYVEFSKNKLFGPPVCLKKFVRNKDEEINHKIFEHLKLNKEQKLDNTNLCICIKNQTEANLKHRTTCQNANKDDRRKQDRSLKKCSIIQSTNMNKEKIQKPSKNIHLDSLKNINFDEITTKDNPLILDEQCNVKRMLLSPLVMTDDIKFSENEKILTKNNHENVILTNYGAYLLGL